MTDTERFHRLRRHFHTGEIPLGTPDCLGAEVIGGLADGTLDVDAQRRALVHLATCASCRRAVASVAEALADGPITHEIEVVEGRTGKWWRHRTFRIALPLAAAATVLVLLRSPVNDGESARGRSQRSPVLTPHDPSGTVHRAGSQHSPVPTPIAPSGVVAGVDRLQWTSVSGADRYRVTLFSAQGSVLYETEVRDTIVPLPDSVRLAAGTPYLWKVEARTGFDRWTGSELVTFTIARAPPL